MTKKVNYFSHDFSARNDAKIISLRRKAGMEGLGIFWAIVEMLYENWWELACDDESLENLAYEWRCEVEKIKIHNIIEKTFIFLFVIMPSEQISLQEKKTIVQRIINNHLPEEERFSIDGLSNDRLEFLVEFLLEEDEIERNKIWVRLEEEIEETKNNLKISTLEVQKIKDLLDHEKLEKWKLQNLLNLVHSEKELEQEIKDLDF